MKMPSKSDEVLSGIHKVNTKVNLAFIV